MSSIRVNLMTEGHGSWGFSSWYLRKFSQCAHCQVLGSEWVTMECLQGAGLLQRRKVTEGAGNETLWVLGMEEDAKYWRGAVKKQGCRRRDRTFPAIKGQAFGISLPFGHLPSAGLQMLQTTTFQPPLPGRGREGLEDRATTEQHNILPASALSTWQWESGVLNSVQWVARDDSGYRHRDRVLIGRGPGDRRIHVETVQPLVFSFLDHKTSEHEGNLFLASLEQTSFRLSAQ